MIGAPAPCETLEQVLADLAGELPVLKRHGAAVSLAEFEKLVRRVKRAAAPFVTFLSETDAALHSGHTVPWLRARRAQWQRLGHVRRTRRGTWEYRECVLPRRANLDAIRADAEQTARGEPAAASVAAAIARVTEGVAA